MSGDVVGEVHQVQTSNELCHEEGAFHGEYSGGDDVAIGEV